MFKLIFIHHYILVPPKQNALYIVSTKQLFDEWSIEWISEHLLLHFSMIRMPDTLYLANTCFVEVISSTTLKQEWYFNSLIKFNKFNNYQFLNCIRIIQYVKNV